MTTPSVNPSARVQRIPAPIASPGQCGMCGKSSHDLGFADARLDFEFYGSLIFCADCTGDLAGVFGYVSPADISGLREQVEAQNSELNTLRQAILGLESAVDGLTNYRDLRGYPSDGNRFGSGVAVVQDTEQVTDNADDPAPEADGVHAEPADAGAGTDSEVNEPPAEQGPDDVSGTSSSVDELLNL